MKSVPRPLNSPIDGLTEHPHFRNLTEAELTKHQELVTAQHLENRKIVMSRRSIVSIAASAIIGSACVAIISNDASAYSSRGIPIYQPGVYRGGVYRGGYYRGRYYRGVARGVATGAGAAGAYYAPRRKYYPYGPCY